MIKALKKILACAIICMSVVVVGCGGGQVDHDLSVKNDEMAYTIVNNMSKSPASFANKTYKIKGDISGGGSNYILSVTDNAQCCTAQLTLKLVSGVKAPKDKTDVIVIGSYLKGDSDYYLEVTKFA